MGESDAQLYDPRLAQSRQQEHAAKRAFPLAAPWPQAAAPSADFEPMKVREPKSPLSRSRGIQFLAVPWYLLSRGTLLPSSDSSQFPGTCWMEEHVSDVWRTQNVGVHCILRVMQCVHSMQRLFNANLPRVMPLPCRRPPRGSRRATQSSPRRPPRRWSRTRRSAHQAKHTRTACYAHTILLLLGETTATQPLYYKLAEARSREYEQCVSIVSRNLSIDFSISEMRR